MLVTALWYEQLKAIRDHDVLGSSVGSALIGASRGVIGLRPNSLPKLKRQGIDINHRGGEEVGT